MLLDETYVVFDLETTGLYADKGDSIIEIGAVKMINGKIIDTFDTFVNPNVKLSSEIISITGITDEMLVDAPNEEDAVKTFIDWVGEYPMVAHNALATLVVRYNIPWDEEKHHRADYDAKGTALILDKMLKKLSLNNINTMSELKRYHSIILKYNNKV